MNVEEDLRLVLDNALQLGARARALTAESGLFGSLPELDSQAVVQLMLTIEDHFGINLPDDEWETQAFATFGSLVAFVASKCA